MGEDIEDLVYGRPTTVLFILLFLLTPYGLSKSDFLVQMRRNIIVFKFVLGKLDIC